VTALSRIVTAEPAASLIFPLKTKVTHTFTVLHFLLHASTSADRFVLNKPDFCRRSKVCDVELQELSSSSYRHHSASAYTVAKLR